MLCTVSASGRGTNTLPAPAASTLQTRSIFSLFLSILIHSESRAQYPLSRARGASIPPRADLLHAHNNNDFCSSLSPPSGCHKPCLPPCSTQHNPSVPSFFSIRRSAMRRGFYPLQAFSQQTPRWRFWLHQLWNCSSHLVDRVDQVRRVSTSLRLY